MKNKILFFAIVLVLLTGCKSYSYEQKESTQPIAVQNSANTNAVIEGFKFLPPSIQTEVGETVTWTQKDDAAHTVTITSGPESFDSGRLGKGQKFSKTFSKPGTYQYICTIHSNMKGTIVVQ